MKTIFLAHWFGDPDKQLVDYVEHLLASHDIRLVTRKEVPGGQLTPEIKRDIENSDGLIALLTRRKDLGDGTWTTHDWVQYELNHARDRGKPTVAVVEEGVQLGGPYADNPQIPLNRTALVETILALSGTIGEWKRMHGRTVELQILPPEVAEQVADEDAIKTCRYRFWHDGASQDWMECRPVPMPGGTFVRVKGVRDEYLIQLHIEGQGTAWSSKATAQHLPVNMKSKGAV
jgi:hypothetical protein